MPKIEKDLLKVKGSDGQWHYIPAVGGGDTPTWDSVQNKPFSTLGGGLSVDENGVLSSEGGGSPEDIQDAVNKYLTENPISVDIATTEKAGIVTVGKNLSITKDGVLSVDTTDDVTQDNTKPITSAGVNLVVGNINALLAII
nr:MAG TPA: hypothetical protein [Bacteriophage sp.]